MRILLVNDLAPGPGSGAEVYVERLAAGLEAAGMAVDVFAGEVSHEGLRRALDLWDPHARRLLDERAARFGADVLHYQNVLNELSPSVFRAGRERARVLTVHDSRIAGVRNGPEVARGLAGGGGAHHLGQRASLAARARAGKDRLARAVAVRSIDVAVAVSEELSQRLRRAGFPRVATVPLFARPEPSPPPLGEDVVFAGQVSREKGPGLLLEAFARVASDHPRAWLRIAGDGPATSEIRGMVRTLGVPRVDLPGVLDSDGVRRLMTGARVVCDPAVTVDGSRTVIIEAAQMARPVVAGDGSGPRELLADGARGIIVPRGDVSALAAALDRLLGDRAAAQEIGRAGWQGLQDRTVEAGVERYHQIYADTVASRRLPELRRGG